MTSQRQTVRCVDCGFLSKRAAWRGTYRQHWGYQEAERYDRDHPRASFTFVPGESNAEHQGEFGCYRAAANFPEEIGAVAGSEGVDRDEAAKRVLTRDRVCAKWIQYEPGLAPAETFREYRLASIEADRQKFERTLAGLNTRLTVIAICVTVIIGMMQLWPAQIAATIDGIGSGLGDLVLIAVRAMIRLLHLPFSLLL